MRLRIIERCISICNRILINHKYSYELKYVVEALNQEKEKNKSRPRQKD